MNRELWKHVSEEEWSDWRWQINNRICDLAQLRQLTTIPEEQLSSLEKVVSTFRFGVTPYYFSLIDFTSPAYAVDPIWQQIIPSMRELENWDKGSWDPLNEEHTSPVSGLIHRYPDRVLVVLTNFCPAYCRHCNRKRNWVQQDYIISREQVKEITTYITDHPKVREVILSGGEPLMLPLCELDFILKSFREIKQVEIIRLGSRVPVTLPQRITDDLLAVLAEYGPIWLNTQFNHYREITPASSEACQKIVRSGIPVNNQTVLLRGINDDAKTILILNQALLKILVRPYYLFQCDLVKGAEHFRTRVATGINMIEHLQGHTSGLAVPVFAIDTPGGGGKVPLLPQYCFSSSPEQVVVRTYRNEIFSYPEPE